LILKKITSVQVNLPEQILRGGLASFMKPEILTRSTVYNGYMTVERVQVRLGDGAVVVREVESHGDAVAVLPYDAERRTALIVRQFRVPAFDRLNQAAIDEACAGMIEDEDPVAAARREAMEELGVAVEVLELVGRVWPSPGVSSERVTLFLAPYRVSDRIGPGGGADGEHEGITAIETSLASLAADADAGLIVDAKLLTLVLTLRLRRPDLFA
jgi:nudix-type nucleoside diphosphatase (YffH/AdpP family)